MVPITSSGVRQGEDAHEEKPIATAISLEPVREFCREIFVREIIPVDRIQKCSLTGRCTWTTISSPAVTCWPVVGRPITAFWARAETAKRIVAAKNFILKDICGCVIY
jgi:hypothetical protein